MREPDGERVPIRSYRSLEALQLSIFHLLFFSFTRCLQE